HYSMVHEEVAHGLERFEPLVVGVEEWRDRIKRLIEKCGDRAYALFPALVQVRKERGPFTLGSFSRNSAHLAAVDLAWLGADRSERIRGGTWLQPPEEIPVIKLIPDVRILTQEIVFEAAAISNGQPAKRRGGRPKKSEIGKDRLIIAALAAHHRTQGSSVENP